VYGSYLLRERTHCRRAYLAFGAAAVRVDAEAVSLRVLSVMSLPRLLGGRIDVGGRASSPRRSEEAWDLFLCLEALAALAFHVAMDLLPGTGVSDAGFVYGCRLCYACLEP